MYWAAAVTASSPATVVAALVAGEAELPRVTLAVWVAAPPGPLGMGTGTLAPAACRRASFPATAAVSSATAPSTRPSAALSSSRPTRADAVSVGASLAVDLRTALRRQYPLRLA